MSLFKKSLVFLCLVKMSVGMAADGTFTNIHQHYRSPRAMGMGNGFIALANDYSAIFYNPAALARFDEWTLNLGIDLSATANFFRLQSQLADVDTSGTDQEKLSAYTQFLQDRYGSNYAVRVGLEGIWAKPNWSVAILPVDLSFELAVRQQALPALDVRAYLDSTVAVAYGDDIRAIPGKFSWGSTFKFVNRGFVNKQVNSLDLVYDSNVFKTSDMREGFTYDLDLGVLYTPDLPTQGIGSAFQLAKPTFAFVVRNIIDQGFKKSLKLLNKNPDPNAEAPERLYRTFEIGSRWEYPSVWIFGGRGTFDIKSLGHPNFSWRKAIHLGLEFDWTVASWWKGQYRVGLNQLYMTAGLSALFTFFRLDVVTYGEDIGYSSGPKENRVYEVKLNVDI